MIVEIRTIHRPFPINNLQMRHYEWKGHTQIFIKHENLKRSIIFLSFVSRFVMLTVIGHTKELNDRYHHSNGSLICFVKIHFISKKSIK